VIECVPNFSEGRDRDKIQAIVDAIASVKGVLLLGWERDESHNRSVVTFAGPVEAVQEGAIRGAGKATELINLSGHEGVHPRVGAADVIPFVPLAGSTMEDCVAAAHRAGEEIWRRFGVPVYFYESAARITERQRLERVRRKAFDGRPPDIGDIDSHPTAGASMVGARGFLIAYNVLLETPDVSIAQRIARRIRESSGGFRYVKAIGLYLADRDCAQVSMNLTHFLETPIQDVIRVIADEASIKAFELIGFVPRQAYEVAPQFFEQAENFDPSRIIETRIDQLRETAP